MKRILCCVGAAALASALAGCFQTGQHVAGAMHPAVPLQDAGDVPAAAAGPAERRLRQLIEAVGSGSVDRIRAFIRAAYEPGVLQRNGEDRVVQYYAAMYDRTRGLTIDSLRATPTEAAALLRAKQTGLWEQLSLRVEPEPPHRLLDFASFSIRPPRHALSAPTATDAQRVREIDRIATRLAEADAFSGVVLVARGDSILYERAFGQLDRARSVRLGTGTRMQLASLTKPFVTVAVARLVEEGKISWEDPLGAYFPGLPAPARERVRIRHLLTHTSGLHELSCEEERCREPARSMDDHVRLALLSQRDSLRFEPGTRSVYTNTNYALLGGIVELASGEDPHNFIRRHVFEPAGMRHTDFYEHGRPSRQVAGAYHREFSDSGVVFTGDVPGAEEPDYGSPWAGSYSTAGDLFRFARALQGGKLVRPGIAELLLSPKDEAGNWGYGFDVLDAGRGLVGHGGSWNGISNSVDMFTKSGYTSVILSNYTSARSPLREAIWSILP